MPKQKLELTWIGKDKRPRLEPRILVEDPNRSYHARGRLSDHDLYDNLLIHGDNLLALKALEQDYAGKVKCIYIDPPYNTGNAFAHYDDGLEHSIWLGMMRERLYLLRSLLSNDGSIWINLDDREAHYCKVICDEMFARNNFIADVIWEKADSPRMDAEFFSVRHDHILVYAKDRNELTLNRIMEIPKHYNRTDDDGRKYYTKPLRAMGTADDTREARPTMYYAIASPSGEQVYPMKQDGAEGRWRWKKEKVLAENDRIDWVEGKNGWTPYYRVYADTSKGRPPETIFPHDQVGTNRTSKAETKLLFPDTATFSTPKPEKLIHHIITLATNPGDLVLDSFLGSGTTAAVAHKMGRRWIGVELGDHCYTHCVPRLRQVIDGTDQGGVSKAHNWKGGGGFRFYELGPSLITTDKWGNSIINPGFNPAMLQQAVCKLEGFTWAPSEDIYWRHGHSTESDFIYVTTQHITHGLAELISEEVGEERSLLVCCKSFEASAAPNLTIKKIPQAVLRKCEWGHDDYSLEVENLPMLKPAPDKPEPREQGPQLELFADEDGGEA